MGFSLILHPSWIRLSYRNLLVSFRQLFILHAFKYRPNIASFYVRYITAAVAIYLIYSASTIAIGSIFKKVIAMSYDIIIRPRTLSLTKVILNLFSQKWEIYTFNSIQLFNLFNWGTEFLSESYLGFGNRCLVKQVYSCQISANHLLAASAPLYVSGVIIVIIYNAHSDLMFMKESLLTLALT